MKFRALSLLLAIFAAVADSKKLKSKNDSDVKKPPEAEEPSRPILGDVCNRARLPQAVDSDPRKYLVCELPKGDIKEWHWPHIGVWVEKECKGAKVFSPVHSTCRPSSSVRRSESRQCQQWPASCQFQISIDCGGRPCQPYETGRPQPYGPRPVNPNPYYPEPQVIVEPPRPIIEPQPYVVPEPQPYVPQPQPQNIVPEPQPYIPEPQPYVPEPQPYGPEPQPYVPEPQPYVPEPQPYVPEPEPYVPEPQPYIPEPQPYVPEPQPYVPVPQPQPYGVPEPQPYQPQPYVPQPQPYVPQPRPIMPIIEPPPVVQPIPPRPVVVPEPALVVPQQPQPCNPYQPSNQPCYIAQGQAPGPQPYVVPEPRPVAPVVIPEPAYIGRPGPVSPVVRPPGIVRPPPVIPRPIDNKPRPCPIADKGGRYCSWMMANLEPSRSKNHFLQCVPASGYCGQWMRRPCAPGTRFEVRIQVCVHDEIAEIALQKVRPPVPTMITAGGPQPIVPVGPGGPMAPGGPMPTMVGPPSVVGQTSPVGPGSYGAGPTINPCGPSSMPLGYCNSQFQCPGFSSCNVGVNVCCQRARYSRQRPN